MKQIIIILLVLSNIIFISLIYSGKGQPMNDTKSPVIIWNDDEESIPMENSLILLEMISNDTIYIGPYYEKAVPGITKTD